MNFIKKATLIILFCLVHRQLACASHYYSSGGVCLECDSNCLECQTEPTFCLSCQEKYSLSNHTCTICPQQCTSCNNSLTCTSCDPGSYLKNDRCAQCMNKCATCNETTCFTCLQGYSFTSTCTLCITGYFWNNIYAVCNKCSPGCQSCTNLEACSLCLNNYLNEEGTCRYNAASNSSDKSQMKIFIIIGAVAAGIIALACTIYIIYRCIASKQIKKDADVEASQVVIKMNQSQGFNEQLSDHLGCAICNEAKGEIIFACGHHFHQGCLKIQAKSCPICRQKLLTSRSSWIKFKDHQKRSQMRPLNNPENRPIQTARLLRIQTLKCKQHAWNNDFGLVLLDDLLLEKQKIILA